MTDHFYIHIPFCRQRCPYCKFALTPIFDEFKKKRYIEYLKKEIREYFSEQNPPSPLSQWGTETIYFGGWTPSVLSHDEIREVLECFPFLASPPFRGSERGYFANTPPNLLLRYNSSPKSGELKTYKGRNPEVENLEITLEANPEDITTEYIEWVLALGINRISVGIQTLNETSLKEIHRSDRKIIFGALESISTCIYSPHEKVSSSPLLGDELYRRRESNGVTQKGIPHSEIPPNLPLSREGWGQNKISLNIDFILGLPFVKPGETLAGIRELYKRFPYITHTSVYMLEDEEYPKHWKSNSITELEMQSEFLEIMDYFDSIWWHHYELSNFAKPWYESVHNRAYWDHSDTRGFGLSAASFEWWKRWNNASSFTQYYRWEQENAEILTPEEIEIENMMFSLRTNWWSTPLIEEPKTIKKLDTLISDWLLEIHESRIKPTKTWIFVIDHILSELISDS